ncbi:MAG: Penicillin-binding protein 4* [Bacteroidota bacterium]|jgi:CubicO group peptidase (beta-lactamase class C family)
MQASKPLYIVLFSLFFLLLFSCSKQEKNGASLVDMIDGHIPILLPSQVNYPKLSRNYIADKRYAIDRFCSKFWSSDQSNLSFLVAKNGQIIYERYQGLGKRETQTPITAETPLHIASVSKVVTATAVLLLVNKNQIKLDQKVSSILPTFPYPEVTIRSLLAHRSGMRNYAYFTEDPGVWDRHQTLSNQDVLRLLGEKNIQLESPSNTHFSYCNTNYAILALVIEKITGLRYPEAIQKMIFNPLGMNHSFVFELDKDQETAMPSYKGNNIRLAYDYLDAVYGDKNIFSTPRDLLKFDMARKSDLFLSPELRKQIYQGYSNERKGVKNYGLGIRMMEWENGKNFYFHNGWWHGSTSTYITLLDENVTIIGLSNKFTKNVYASRKLASLFGDYPFEMEDDE